MCFIRSLEAGQSVAVKCELPCLNVFSYTSVISDDLLKATVLRFWVVTERKAELNPSMYYKYTHTTHSSFLFWIHSHHTLFSFHTQGYFSLLSGFLWSTFWHSSVSYTLGNTERSVMSVRECSVFHLKTEADPTSEILYFFTAWDDERCLRSECVFITRWC